MKRLENLDGFMIGRHAIGNPWCFQDSKKYPQPVLGERIRVALDHYGLLCKIQPERVAVKEFRKYLGHYVNGFQHAKAWRARLMECESSPEFVACMNRLQQEEGLLQLAS
jgi:tRNA-dihydrouridine synthase B